MKRLLRAASRDEQFHETYQRTLRDIEERLAKLPPDDRKAEAYSMLRGFFETMLDAGKNTLPIDQQVEMKIILHALERAIGADEEKGKR